MQEPYADDVRTHNLLLDRWLRSHSSMNLKKWKAIKVSLLSLILVAYGVYSIQQGADPGPALWVVVTVIALLNGIELSELVAVWAELKYSDDTASDDSGGGGNGD